ncbi:hypothetical protein ACB098_04G115000 [Castanea mollissima]
MYTPPPPPNLFLFFHRLHCTCGAHHISDTQIPPINPTKKERKKKERVTHREQKRKRDEVEGDSAGSTPLVHQRSTGSSLRSGSIADSPAFILVGLQLLLEFLPYNLVGVEAMALSFIKTLALVCEGLELNFGTELSQRTESESELHTIISFVMYFLIFDCLAVEKTMRENFRSGLVFLVLLTGFVFGIWVWSFRFMIWWFQI